MDETPAYDQVAEILRRSITSNALPVGQVLLEGPLAKIFGSSRSPIRSALALLEQEGLLARFEGRGLVVGNAAGPLLRETPTAELLQLAGTELAREPVWRRIYDGVERDLIYASVLDPRRINEVEMARHYGIGRSAAGLVLHRAEANGIITRDSSGRWSTVLLDRARIVNLYRVRSLLEPEAMANIAAADVGRDESTAMLDRLLAARERYPSLSAEQLDALETDLHVDHVERNGNGELVRALHHTRCTIIISKHALSRQADLPPNDPFIVEHIRIVEAILDLDPARARQAMRDHLDSAVNKVADRVEAMQATATVSAPSYLQAPSNKD